MEHKVTVIVPVYKVEAYLHRCIDSIINQTYKNLEIILVDDGSPDKCGDICEEYATKDDRIIVIHQKNQGLSCARNTGLDIASGTYISHVDSDDHMATTMIEKLLSCILEFDLDIVETPIYHSWKKNDYDEKLTIENPIKASKRILETTAFSVWRRLYKASFVEGMRFIPGLIHQDVFYTLDTMKKLPKYGYLNIGLYFYNNDSDSIIRSKYTLKKITTGIRATEYIINNHLDHRDISQTVKNYVVYYYTDHFFLLSRNTEVDKNKFYRKELKKSIIENFSIKNISFRTVLVVFLPVRIMEIVSKIYISTKTILNNK
ncbi:glycosyltransferase [uncultured Winogradskyella sp.]|uniref:glycosyltransferase n=1 Tax=uncultured Winogradskyella sp. TaxID=395353 RepID=UPI0030DA14B3|tara:strand:+ start:99273 stop:100223 length:951 start_codon:yes stop_codon:yes gene_type:complete